MEGALAESVLNALTESKDVGQTIDILEMALTCYDAAKTELRHAFTPGLYSRSFDMPGGAMVISETHLTEHQYVVSKGDCLVYNALDNTVERITAPYHGVTKPGTRRVILVFEDTTWTTFHATTETDPDVIKSQIVKQRIQPQP